MGNLVKGIASFEGETASNMVAYCDPSKRWNGWAMPYIHADYIEDLIARISYEDCILEMSGDNIRVYEYYEGEIQNSYVIEPVLLGGDNYYKLNDVNLIDGEMYYDFGFMGLCFDFEPLKEDARRQAIIVDIEGLIYDDDEVEPLQLGEIVYVNEYGANEWQVYVESQYNGGSIHGIDTERIKLI